MNIGLFEVIFGLFFTGLGDVKLDSIAKNVDEIRLDNKDFTKTVNKLSERITTVESNVESVKERVDGLEKLHLTK